MSPWSLFLSLVCQLLPRVLLKTFTEIMEVTELVYHRDFRLEEVTIVRKYVRRALEAAYP